MDGGPSMEACRGLRTHQRYYCYYSSFRYGKSSTYTQALVLEPRQFALAHLPDIDISKITSYSSPLTDHCLASFRIGRFRIIPQAELT